ncbi:MAG: virulence protein RhuM/Fic/DOC family protein [Bacteroidetes bacterium]|nr:virulence protein RhuM/Fic/DOC family protein [Bacteroidota bacterium]
MKSDQIEIFRTSDGQIHVNVTFREDTVWLNQEQLSQLFGRDRTVIGRHLGNIFSEAELTEELVCADFAHTSSHGAMKGRKQTKSTRYYNLDVIISVGYRVKSKRGVEFRQWATQRLREFLVQGYVINEKRLAQKEMVVQHLRTGIQILSRAIEERAQEPGKEWLLQYAQGLTLLDDYDHENLDPIGISKREVNYPSLEAYYEIIHQMRSDFESEVFGVKKDMSFESAVSQISQSFGDDDAYPSIEEKAAMLLYLITKNHAFTDGNKRIAAACFLLFLEKNHLLTNKDGKQIISNDALASLTLLVAASKPSEMAVVKKLIISVLNRNQ